MREIENIQLLQDALAHLYVINWDESGTYTNEDYNHQIEKIENLVAILGTEIAAELGWE